MVQEGDDHIAGNNQLEACSVRLNQIYFVYETVARFRNENQQKKRTMAVLIDIKCSSRQLAESVRVVRVPLLGEQYISTFY